jgi:nucleoid-associated protein
MQLENIIAYYIHKAQHDVDHVELAEPDSSSLIDAADESAISFVNEVRSSYRKDSGNYGEFETTSHFKSILTNIYPNCDDFSAVTHDLVLHLRDVLRLTSAATGGHVVYFQYQENNVDYFMAVLLKDKEGFMFNAELGLQNASYLDIDRLHLAARINLQEWLNDGARYISFLTGRNRQEEVRSYFRTYLGIDFEQYENAADNTRTMANAVVSYCQQQEYTLESENEVRRRVTEYAREKVDAEELVELSHLANLVDPDQPDRFSLYCNSEDIALNGQFHVSKRELRSLTRYTGRDSEVSISFDHDAITNERVSYDLNADTITIQRIPRKIREALEESERNE